jgi:hypothetical protein
MWTFETTEPWEKGYFARDSYQTMEEAAEAAAQWMRIAARNKVIVTVRLKRLEPAQC